MDFTNLDAFLENKLPSLGVPGGDLNVWYKHENIYRKTYGWFDRENKVPMTKDALYFLYSCSKPITCAAALVLHEHGGFLMNDPVEWYLPEFANVKVRARDRDGNVYLRPPKRKMTVFNLFNMTAGLNYNLETEEINQVIKNNPNASTREIVKAIAQSPLDFDPGDRWQYSLCHDVLAALVEEISGMKFRDYVKKYIFEPLEMNDSFYTVPDDKKNRIAKQYWYKDEKKACDLVATDNNYALTPEYDSGGAGIVSSNEDYMKFASMMANWGMGENGNRILSPRSIELMRSDGLTDTNRDDFNWKQMQGYGYAYGVRTHINRSLSGSLSSIGEFGWGGAAGAYIAIDPDNDLAIVYTQHMRNSLEEIIHPRIRNLVYASIFR